MTHYRPPTGFALVECQGEYHIVRDGQYEALCPIGWHFGASVKRITTEIPSHALCKLCRLIAEVEATS